MAPSDLLDQGGQLDVYFCTFHRFQVNDPNSLPWELGFNLESTGIAVELTHLGPTCLF